MAKADWLTISPVEGSGDASVSNSGTKYEGRENRSCEVTATAVDVVPNKKYTVVQEAVAEFVTFDKASISALAGSTVTLTGRSNAKSLSFESSNPDVVSFASTYKVNDTLDVAVGADIDGDPGASGAYTFAIDVTFDSVEESTEKTVRVSGNTSSAEISVTITPSTAVAILINADDSSDIHEFESCEDAATYATENSSTNWELTINSGEVPSSCFRNITNLVKLTLNEGVTGIEAYAFQSCTGLTGELKLPSTLTWIGGYAFRNCSGFTGELVIPAAVTSLGNYAFQGCTGLTGALIIPAAVTSLGNYAFGGCTGFTSLSIEGGDEALDIEVYAFTGCTGLTGALIIPARVTKLGNSAFYNCSGFTSLTIEDGDSSLTIGNYTFRNCSGFTGALVLPARVTSIGQYAFQNCSGFDDDLSYGGTSDPWSSNYAVFGGTNITVCKVSSDYEDETFCGLPIQKQYNVVITTRSGTEYNFDTAEEARTFLDSTIESCDVLIRNIESIPSNWLVDLINVSSVTIGNGVVTIGARAFYNCSSITSLIFDNCTTLNRICAEAFYGCMGITSALEIPEGVTTIDPYAFDSCVGISGLTLPSTLTVLNEQTFANIAFLTSVTIPASIIYMGNKVFYGCESLSSVRYEGTTNPDTGSLGNQFDYTQVTEVSVPLDYADQYFCGLPVTLSD